MRITREQIETIVETTKSIVGQNTRVWLYGSRVDDTRRGGDIDLLIESEPVAGIIERALIKSRLEQSIHYPVDVLATRLDGQDSPFVTIARARAIRLN